jgi:CRP-like cAMP-binding protein
VAFKRWFGEPRRPEETAEYTLEDLIVLERYGDAEQRLKQRLKANPDDLHAHLKLAEVYTASQQYDKAVEEYVYVAGEYGQDGFHDKGLALLAKAAKLRPLDETVARRMEAFERAKRLEQSRVVALEGLRAGSQSDAQRQRAALELQQIWHNLAGSPLVRRLPDDQLKRLLSVMEIVRVEPGTILTQAGSTLAQLALVGRGVLEAVAARPGGGETVLRTFTTGDVIGEGALLEHRPWPATYRVAEAATLLTLDRTRLEQALIGNPDPRGFLEALREQRQDRAVAQALQHLGAAS